MENVEGLRNRGLQDQLKTILENIHKSATEKVARRVADEENIRLDRTQRESLMCEVNAWEGRPIYVREKPGAPEKKVFCQRVGMGHVLVCENGSEPKKLYRTPELRIRTNEERLLGIFDQKVARVAVRGKKILEDAVSALTKQEQQRTEHLEKQVSKMALQFQSDMNSLEKFRNQMYSRLIRSGRVIPSKESQAG